VARALVSKKADRSGSGRLAKGQRKVRAKAKGKSKLHVRKHAKQVKAVSAKSRKRSVAEKPKRRGSAGEAVKQSPQKERMSMASGTKKRISTSGTVTAPPEKPVRALSETKTTPGALLLLEKGIKLIYQREFKKARHELDSLIESYPSEAEISARARSYIQICDREEAAQKKTTVSNDQLYTLGVMEHNRGNYDGAISYFEQLLANHPNADYIYYSLAASKARKNEIAEAIQNLRKAIDLNEDNRVYAKNDPDFAPLHVEREFVDLVGLKLV